MPLALPTLRYPAGDHVFAVRAEKVGTVAVPEWWKAACGITRPGLFDLDDIRAHISERHCCEWPSQGPTEIEDTNSVQSAIHGHHFTLSLGVPFLQPGSLSVCDQPELPVRP
ncbi:hypothetical protein BH23CHL5_BH23CHL5_18390 [soil metagenome]